MKTAINRKGRIMPFSDPGNPFDMPLPLPNCRSMMIPVTDDDHYEYLEHPPRATMEPAPDCVRLHFSVDAIDARDVDYVEVVCHDGSRHRVQVDRSKHPSSSPFARAGQAPSGPGDVRYRSSLDALRENRLVPPEHWPPPKPFPEEAERPMTLDEMRASPNHHIEPGQDEEGKVNGRFL